ncbi:hypothetical protein BCR34DRAFT_626949 [Clohesyomyces aquaticus]|uniref:Uncharacterized protein n=1 Tax=Clohesyomyces aquaticus TaxID=1231657 RepID=A0A1Y1Z3W2_9PLEO|nr:hypothetical protein BCR34DRAFT_626949 [Clohesyomyces aquaticus]
MVLVAGTLITCIPIASVSIHRCRLSWHFTLIGIWKLVTSFSLACVTFHRAIVTMREKRGNGAGHDNVPLNPMYHQPNATNVTFGPNPNQTPTTNYHPLYWLILYLLGTITGMTGLGALIYTSFRHNKDVRNLTYGFAAAIVIIPILTACYFFMEHLEKSRGGYQSLLRAYLHTFSGALVAFTVAFGFLSGIYSDLVLGAIAGRWSGAPSEDYAPLYWAWFVAKRLAMFVL